MEKGGAFTLCLTVGLFLFYLVLGQTCDRYWLLHDDMCFRQFADQVSYLEAKRQCSSARARLVTNVTDDLGSRLFNDRRENENSSFWCQTGSDGDDDMFFLPGLILERRKRSTSCCFIQNMEYGLAECDEFKGYICEKEPTSLIHLCLQNTTIDSNASDWVSARKHCQCNGGDLYSFNSTSEEEYFSELAREKNESVWIGLRREADSDEFLWSDGTLFKHSIWDGQEPDTDDNTKLCVGYTGTNGTWDVFHCNTELSFICKGTRTFTNASLENTTAEAAFTNASIENTTAEAALTDASVENTTAEAALTDASIENTTAEADLANSSIENTTAEAALTTASIENTKAESGYMSACSPVFENCYVPGFVVGIIIFLTAIAVAVAYTRLRKKKEKKPEAPVELLHVQNYKEDIPAKALAAKIKEVIA